MQLQIGELVQHMSGEIGMIVKISEPFGIYHRGYEVEWYNKHGCMRGSGISEYDIKRMHERYLNFRDWVYGIKNR